MKLTKCVAFLAALAAAGPGSSQDKYPAKPVRFVVNNAPGAGTDITARLVANGIAPTFGPVVIDNRPGGNGVIGVDAARRAPADGYTFLATNDGTTYRPAVAPNIGYDILKDFDPVVAVGTIDFFLVVNTEVLPASTVQELAAQVRKLDGKLSYPTPGFASPQHLGMELLKYHLGFDATHVPYKAMATGVADMVAGRVQLTITGYPAVAAYVSKGGKALRLIAATGKRRSPLRPELPTLAEAGLPDFNVKGASLILAPAGTPKPMIDRMNAEVNKLLATEEMRGALAAQATRPDGGSPEALREQIQADLDLWGRFAKTTRIRLE